MIPSPPLDNMLIYLRDPSFKEENIVGVTISDSIGSLTSPLDLCELHNLSCVVEKEKCSKCKPLEDSSCVVTDVLGGDEAWLTPYNFMSHKET